jgi:integrase
LKRHYQSQLEAKKKAGASWQEHVIVFCTSIGTHLNPTRDMLDQLKMLLKRAGLSDVRFHDLRHSAAPLLLSEGVHLSTPFSSKQKRLKPPCLRRL